MASTGPIPPVSVYLSGASGNLSSGFYQGGGGNAAAYIEGIQVVASLGVDSTAVLQFNVPLALPTGTLKLQIVAVANATSGAAKLTISDVAVTPAAAPTANANKVGTPTMNAESQTTITWTTSWADGLQLTKVTLTTAPAAADVLSVAVKFQTSGWTLAQISTWLFSIIWE